MNIYLSQRHPHADGVTPDTELFQQALDELAQAGGGRLVVECGRYALGGLRIGSNTCLWLSSGAELIVSENYDDFAQATALSRAESSDRAFLYAVDAQNITICGGELPSRPTGKYHRTTCPDVDNPSGLLHGRGG